VLEAHRRDRTTRHPATAASKASGLAGPVGGAVALGAVCALLAGCAHPPALTAGTASPASTSPPATTAGGAPATASGSRAPLTGASIGRRAAGRPAVAIAISGAAPAGLGSADVVFQETGSPMRYLAIFQSRQAGSVGPVAGTLPSDGPLLSVLHPLTGYNGGSAPSIRILDRSQGIVDKGYATNAALYTVTGQGLTASTSAFYAAADGDGSPPQLFSYRRPGTASTLAATGQSQASSVRITMPGLPTQTWDFQSQSGRWALTSGGPQVQVANLIIQMVSYKQVFLSHRDGVTAQSPLVLGTGKVMAFSTGKRGGTSAAGSWAKRGARSVTAYLDSRGYPMTFTSGPNWIILAPPGTRIGT
jgi:Protein of unknown function (DUF3048) C-terminal domain/Protein of unknown function (DUF3048) N-terminal domain